MQGLLSSGGVAPSAAASRPVRSANCRMPNVLGVISGRLPRTRGAIRPDKGTPGFAAGGPPRGRTGSQRHLRGGAGARAKRDARMAANASGRLDLLRECVGGGAKRGPPRSRRRFRPMRRIRRQPPPDRLRERLSVGPARIRPQIVSGRESGAEWGPSRPAPADKRRPESIWQFFGARRPHARGRARRPRGDSGTIAR